MFRQILFWSHLACGVVAGLVILMMSVTGVLLTYERQILAWQEEKHFAEPDTASGTLPLDLLLERARASDPDLSLSSISVNNGPGAPIIFTAGRRGSVALNPQTGDIVETGSPGLEAFFGTIEGLHRWFNLSGDARSTGRAITGASNLMFLFIVISGIYLWFPRLWKWGMFKARLWFRNTGGNSKARDFNWHHVFGIWSAIPLVFIVATASVFYYPWANALVYQIYGEEVPGRGTAPTPGNTSENAELDGKTALSLDELYSRASLWVEQHHDPWRVITLPVSTPPGNPVDVTFDLGNGGQPQHRHNVLLDGVTGEILESRPFSSQSPGRRTRSIIRFLHTGEVLGPIGQTLAGLVSLASVFMVWTGLALAWRRLISPLLNRKS